jgi:hypothetical protein
MSTPPASHSGAAPGRGPTTLDPLRYRRQPLGLPAGSVRSLLALMILGLLWTLMILSLHKDVSIPLYLYYLTFLVLGHYFAARGAAPAPGEQAERPPLYLPRGSLRILMVLGFAAVLGWGLYNDPDFLHRLQPSAAADQPYLPLVLLGAFFLGVVVSRVSYQVWGWQGSMPAWFQDIQAWIALLAMLGLAAEILIRLVINPTLEADRQLHLPAWETILAAIVGFYFGARS